MLRHLVEDIIPSVDFEEPVVEISGWIEDSGCSEVCSSPPNFWSEEGSIKYGLRRIWRGGFDQWEKVN